jgi:GNAT superfamily N-acetyltransferase
MVLRQLFVRESYRRQGIGSALVEYWWEDVAKEWCEDEDEDYYYVEGPNDEMRELIISIPHDGEDGQPTAYEHHATAN